MRAFQTGARQEVDLRELLYDGVKVQINFSHFAQEITSFHRRSVDKRGLATAVPVKKG